MEKYEEAKIVSGIAIVYIITTSVFSFLNKLSLLIIKDDSSNIGFKTFFSSSILWIIVVAGIIIALTIYANKYNQKVCLNILDNTIVRSSAGILISIEGLVNLSSSLPIRISGINSAIQVSQQVGQTVQGIIAQSIVSNTVAIAISICQILFGVYLVKFYKEKIN
jgi:hypothetical protein